MYLDEPYPPRTPSPHRRIYPRCAASPGLVLSSSVSRTDCVNIHTTLVIISRGVTVRCENALGYVAR